MSYEPRMKELIALVNEAIYNYYVLDNPTISDAEYDALFYELVDLEKQTGTVMKNSPTTRAAGSVSAVFKKVQHQFKLYSLDKCNSHDELREFILGVNQLTGKKNKFSLEYKFDGLRLILKYIGGKLVTASTRGNGTVGEDVTLQVKAIKSVPHKIDFKGELTVCGEGMMSLSNFKEYNKTADEPLKNPRNAAAGAIRNLDPMVTKQRNLDVFCYDILGIEGKEFATQSQMNDFLKEQNFLTSAMFFVSDSPDEVIKQIEKTDKIKDNLDFMIDGMVIKLDDIKIREDVGYTSRFPKWVIAYKFEAVEITSILQGVVWQVGRTGKITPIGLLSPVELAGATVTRATLNNYQEILRKKVKLNSSIFVRRSNEVIPEVLGLAQDFENSKPIEKIWCCPSCAQALVEVGPNLFCKNARCKEQIIGRLVHFCSRNCMNIEGVSDKICEVLYEKCNMRSVADLYSLKASDLKGLEGFGTKKIDNILAAIEKSRQIALNRFLHALSIDNVGEKTAKDLARYFKTLQKLRQAGLKDLVVVQDIGEVVANSIISFFEDEENKRLIERLLMYITLEELLATGDKLRGAKFVITGTLPTYERKQLQQMIEDNGGTVLSKVSKLTNFVVAGSNPGSKFDDATKLGIAIIDEAEFLKLIQ